MINWAKAKHENQEVHSFTFSVQFSVANLEPIPGAWGHKVGWVAKPLQGTITITQLLRDANQPSTRLWTLKPEYLTETPKACKKHL